MITDRTVHASGDEYGLSADQTWNSQITRMADLELRIITTASVRRYAGSLWELRGRIHDGYYAVPGRTHEESVEMVDEAVEQLLKWHAQQRRAGWRFVATMLGIAACLVLASFVFGGVMDGYTADPWVTWSLTLGGGLIFVSGLGALQFARREANMRIAAQVMFLGALFFAAGNFLS